MLSSPRYVPVVGLAVVNLLVGSATAQSQVQISTFSDNECNTLSTTAPANLSVSLDTCLVTVGMESYYLPTIPCAGGGASSVRRWSFSDQNCVKDSSDLTNWGNGCYGSFRQGDAIAAIMLTCNGNQFDPPKAVASTTISVAPVATGAPGSSSGSSSGSGSGSGGSSDTNTNADCSGGWSCLSRGVKIGAILGAVAGISIISYAIRMTIVRRNRREALAAAALLGAARQHERDSYQPPMNQYYPPPPPPSQPPITINNNFGGTQQWGHNASASVGNMPHGPPQEINPATFNNHNSNHQNVTNNHDTVNSPPPPPYNNNNDHNKQAESNVRAM